MGIPRSPSPVLDKKLKIEQVNAARPWRFSPPPADYFEPPANNQTSRSGENADDQTSGENADNQSMTSRESIKSVFNARVLEILIELGR